MKQGVSCTGWRGPSRAYAPKVHARVGVGVSAGVSAKPLPTGAGAGVDRKCVCAVKGGGAGGGGGRPSDMVKDVPNNGSLQAKAPPHCDGWARCHPQPAREHGHGSQRRPRPLSPHHRICPVDVEEDIKMYGSRDLGAGLLAGTTNVVVDFCKEREREVFRPTRAARLFNAVLPASEAGRVPGPPHPCPPAHSI